MLFLSFLIAGICVCTGYGLAMVTNHRQLQSARTETAIVRDEAKSSGALERRELREFSSYVQSLAAVMDDNMDRHSTRVATVSEGIVQNAATDPNVVLLAATQLLEANGELLKELHSAREQIAAKQQQLETYMSEARTDALTGLWNRRAFDQEMFRQFAQRKRQGNTISLLLADVDHFKLFNDYHGHQAGDEMLRQVAATFERTMRDMDLVCRYGGEEFAIILPGIGLENALRAAQRAHAAVERMTYQIANAQLNVTVSLGVAEVLGDEGVECVIKRADDALYAAKEAGRNGIRYHDGSQCLAATVPLKAAVTSGEQTAPLCPDGLAQGIVFGTPAAVK